MTKNNETRKRTHDASIESTGDNRFGKDTRRQRASRNHSPQSQPASFCGDKPGIKRRDTVPKNGDAGPLEGHAETNELDCDLQEIAILLDSEKHSGLRIGKIAHGWIGRRRYNRILNANTFAKEFERVTGREINPRLIRGYVEAHRVHDLVTRAGVGVQHLKLTHFEQLAKCRTESDDELIELARRANEQQVPVRKIKTLSATLHAELTRKSRTVDLIPTECKVRCTDAVDLLRDQTDGSVECLIADWQWCPVGPSSQDEDAPRPACPGDPVNHLIVCLELAEKKLTPEGLILLHYTSVAFLDQRIVEAIDRFGFKHAGVHIWQKTCGGFQAGNSPLMIGHEPTFLLCRKEHVPKSCSGGVNSVSPRLAAPSRANSGMTKLHPFQKPVALYETLIGIATVNGLVVDLFAGSGSAGVAAVRLGCQYIGAEIVPEIAETANRRIALAKGENEEAVDAVNFFFDGASETEREVIKKALAKSGLRVVINADKEVRS